MKALISVIFLLSLSTSLFAQDSYRFNIYNVDAYNQSIPALSLAITPKKSHGFQFILSYVSTLFSLEEPSQEYLLSDDYSNVQISLNFKF